MQPKAKNYKWGQNKEIKRKARYGRRRLRVSSSKQDAPVFQRPPVMKNTGYTCGNCSG